MPLFLTYMFVCFALPYVRSRSACASQSLAVSHLLSEILPQGSSTRTKIMSDYISDSQVSQSTFVSHLLCNIFDDFPSTAAIFDQIIAQLCSCSCPLECCPVLRTDLRLQPLGWCGILLLWQESPTEGNFRPLDGHVTPGSNNVRPQTARAPSRPHESISPMRLPTSRLSSSADLASFSIQQEYFIMHYYCSFVSKCVTVVLCQEKHTEPAVASSTLMSHKAVIQGSI